MGGYEKEDIPLPLRLRRVMSIALRQIANNKVDVIGFQEMDYYREFAYVLAVFGFGGKFTAKEKCSATINYNGNRRDGVATFWNYQRLSLVKSEGFTLPVQLGAKNKNVDKHKFYVEGKGLLPEGIIEAPHEWRAKGNKQCEKWDKKKKDWKLITPIGKQCGQYTVLELREGSKQQLATIVSHSKSGKADDEEGPIKLAQAKYIIKKMVYLKQAYGKQDGTLPVTILCDFNTDANATTDAEKKYDVYTKFKGFAKAKGELYSLYETYEEIFGKPLPFTCPKKRDDGEQQGKLGITMATIDFIFHCARWACSGVFNGLDLQCEEMNKFLYPNQRFPSDHPYMMSRLVLTPDSNYITPTKATNADQLWQEMAVFKEKHAAQDTDLKIAQMLDAYFNLGGEAL